MSKGKKGRAEMKEEDKNLHHMLVEEMTGNHNTQHIEKVKLCYLVKTFLVLLNDSVISTQQEGYKQL